MEELFNAYFKMGGQSIKVVLGFDQSTTLFDDFERFVSADERRGGMDLTVVETESHPGHEITHKFRVETADVFILYRRLGTHLRRHCLDNESRILLHEANS